MTIQTLITTALEPDAYRTFSAAYRMNRLDRQLIDTQIIGAQQHLAASLIRGQVGTYFKAAVGLNAGDVVCAFATPATEGNPFVDVRVVTLATAAALASAGMALGIVMHACPANGYVRVALLGLVGPTITGLAAGAAGLVRVNTTTGRCERVAGFTTGDLPVGAVDNVGNLTLQCERAVSAGGGSGGYTTIKNSAGTAQTQRSVLKFGTGFTVADVGGETVVTATATGGGGGMGFPFTLSTTTTDADPGAGTLRGNQATLANSTKLFVDDVESGGTTVSSWLATFDDSISSGKGTVRLQSKSDPTKWLEWSITAYTSASGYSKIDVVAPARGPGGLTTTAGDTQVIFDAGATGSALAGIKTISFLDYDAGTSGTTKTIDLSNGSLQHLLMTGNCAVTVTGGVAGTDYRVKFVQDGTGSRVVSSWTGVTWVGGVPPTFSTTPGAADFVSFTHDGTTLWGSVVGGSGGSPRTPITLVSNAATLSLATSESWILNASSTAAATILTIPTTGSPTEGQLMKVAVKDQGHQVTLRSGGTSVDAWVIPAHAAELEYTLQWDTVDWNYLSSRRIT